MTKFKSTLSGVLLATSALIAPAVAMAQPALPQDAVQQTPAQQAAPQSDEPSQVDEIVVLGRYIPEPNRESSEVAAFLTSEDLERTGDSSAAAALTRVTGLSIVEGRFVYVRGLGERYSSALLNGSPLPSPEPLQRVVPLDLFPSNVLDSITVQKTYSANLPGEFGGGVIDLQTIDAPNEPFFNFGVTVGANTESTNKEGLIYYGSDSDWTGFDDGTREVPDRLAIAFASGQQIGFGDYSSTELQAIGQSLVNAPLRLLQSNKTPANFGADISGGLSSDSSLGTLGLVFVAGYDNSWTQRHATQQEGGYSGDELVALVSNDVNSNQNDVRSNLLTSLSLSNENNEVKWTNFYVRTTTKEARSEVGPDDINAGGAVLRTDYTEWFVRQLFTSQLTGQHDFMDGALTLDWRAAYAKTSRDAPYESYFRYGQDDEGNFFHSPNSNLISFSELDDEIVSGGADVTYRLPLSNAREAVFTFGVASSDNNRTAERRDLVLAVDTFTEDQSYTRIDFLYSDYNINPSFVEIREITGANGAAAYDADLKVNAAYAMVDAEIIPLVRTTVGVRFEDGKQTVTPLNLFGGVSDLATTEIDEQYVLPSITATWNFAEDQQLRLGASQTIGRPQFRELARQFYTDPDSDRSFTGNPRLVDTEILNLDARYEWFFARQQYVTAGVFYKNLDKPIEALSSGTSGNRYQSYINAPEAVVMGVELEAKKYWEFPNAGHSFLSNKRWLVSGNYTFSDSEVKVDEDDTVLEPANGDVLPAPASLFITDGSRLQGQSDHIANLQFGWEDDTARSQATLIVNYVSERITARGAGRGDEREPDYIQDPGVFLDFVYRKDFTLEGRELGFSLELRNLLGTDFDEYQEDGNKILINNYDLGSSASIGLTAKF